MRDIEDDRPEPDSLAAIAAEHGVELTALRAALAESHPDASPAEVIAAAREVEGHQPRGWQWHPVVRTGRLCATCLCRAPARRLIWPAVQGAVPPRAGARPRTDPEPDR